MFKDACKTIMDAWKTITQSNTRLTYVDNCRFFENCMHKLSKKFRIRGNYHFGINEGESCKVLDRLINYLMV